MTTLKRKLVDTIAEHLADRVMDVLADHYERSPIRPEQEEGLRDNICRELRIQISDLA